jgi:hypothetical protein
MNSEEDTFRILKRTPFNEVVKEVRELGPWIRMDNQIMTKFFEDHGWTYDEYVDKVNKEIHD